MEFLIWLFSSSRRMFFTAAGVLVGSSYLQHTAKAKQMSGDIFVSLHADVAQPVASALDSVGE